jgi:CHAD domain-containing protein
MRYLLDSYGSVYAPGPRKDVLRALKSLQDCLGDIQDVDVQRAELSEIAGAMSRRGASTDAVLAVGALRDRTLRRDTAAREVLARRLERFCSAATRAQVRALGSPA